MTEFFSKVKNYAKGIAIYGLIFIVVFLVSFYAVNLDLRPVEQKEAATSAPAESVDVNAEIKKRLGSTTFSVESYDEWAKRFNLVKADSGLDADPDKEGLPNYLEYVHGTDPLNADTDKDKFTDKQEITNGYDPDAPGDAKPEVKFNISKIGVSAPMVWSQSDKEADMLKDLENGLSHFAKTAAPGQNGNAVISGHSSNYAWAKGNYNYVFRKLSDLEKGDIVTVKTTQENGRVITYTYKVADKYIAAPDEDRIFADTKNPTLTLSTCWPIGTTLKRTIVKAELVQ